jgi:hypothetical protein
MTSRTKVGWGRQVAFSSSKNIVFLRYGAEQECSGYLLSSASRMSVLRFVVRVIPVRRKRRKPLCRHRNLISRMRWSPFQTNGLFRLCLQVGLMDCPHAVTSGACWGRRHQQSLQEISSPTWRNIETSHSTDEKTTSLGVYLCCSRFACGMRSVRSNIIKMGDLWNMASPGVCYRSWLPTGHTPDTMYPVIWHLGKN